MKIKKSLSLWGGFLTCLCFSLTACGYGGYVSPHQVQQALDYAGSVADSIENVETDVAVLPGCTKEDFARIKKMAVVFKQSHTDIANVTNAFSDNLTLELLKMNVEVVETDKVDNLVQVWRMQARSLDEYNITKIGRSLGVDAVLTGTVSSVIRHKLSFTGVSRGIIHVVQNASLKIICCKKDKTLMVITLDYKKGQKARDAAKAMAAILKQRLTDPFG